jgi:hypothetical protein
MVFMGYKPRNKTGGALELGFLAHNGLVQGKEIQENHGKPCFLHELSGFLHILTSTNSGKHKRMFKMDNSESMCLRMKTWESDSEDLTDSEDLGF